MTVMRTPSDVDDAKEVDLHDCMHRVEAVHFCGADVPESRVVEQGVKAADSSTAALAMLRIVAMTVNCEAAADTAVERPMPLDLAVLRRLGVISTVSHQVLCDSADELTY
jgi:hypothetical protein